MNKNKRSKNAAGFSLIELMIAVAIIGILSAIAIPAYGNYLMRARLTEAFSALSSTQNAAEEYWANQHTYVGFDAGTPSRMPPAGTNFTYTLVNPSPSGFTIKATGKGQAAGFNYTIDQSGKRTSDLPAGWGSSDSCWIDRKGGQCVQ
jgi:type IV pilus assembly protein PilE